MSDPSPAGGIDPALADAVHSITATHEDEFPRGREPDAATDVDDGATQGDGVSDDTADAGPTDAEVISIDAAQPEPTGTETAEIDE